MIRRSVYELSNELIFPNPELGEDDGLLAFGGDLSMERLLLAYSNGIFPWYNEGEPIMWWSPRPNVINLSLYKLENRIINIQKIRF